jgi:hypothetical protein
MTKTKTILAAAQGGCSWMKEQTATMSCAAGMTFDATSGTCVPEATS